MHVFLMFSSFQMPLQMRLTTQLVIIFTLCLLCLLLCAVFSALSSAACTTAQYQASMQKWPNKLCKNHWAENSSEAYPGKSGNWRPKQNAISKLASSGAAQVYLRAWDYTLFRSCFLDLVTVSPFRTSGLRGAKAPMLTLPQAIHFISAPQPWESDILNQACCVNLCTDADCFVWMFASDCLPPRPVL